VNSAALETYLAGVDAAAAALVRALDEAVRKAHPDFDVAVKYKMLMYALRGGWRWVWAIAETKKTICLRFLYGVLLDDPLGVLRAGSSVLKTWDFAFDDVVDPAVVGAYVSGPSLGIQTTRPTPATCSRRATPLLGPGNVPTAET